MGNSASQNDYTHDVFLSYNRAQKDWTRKLAQRLIKEGFKVWFDERELTPNQKWVSELAQGVEKSKKTALVISPEYLNAEWTMFEAHIAIWKDPSGRKDSILRILHTFCNTPPELALRQMIDFSDTHDDSMRFEFKLAQLMAHLDPSRECPKDFDLFCQSKKDLSDYDMPDRGSLPAGSVMPYSPNQYFVGREDELKWLYNRLEAGASVSLGQTAVATGLGGIGKTQLAVEFAYRYGKRYDGGVYWLDMSDSEGIANQIAQFAAPSAMNIQGYGQLPQDQVVNLVIREWHGQRNRLIIFDNVEDMELVDKWKPKYGRTRVLITTRIDSNDHRWSARGIETLPVDKLPRDKSLELLCRGRKDALKNPDEYRIAYEICELLGDLPLAIHLAGAYLSIYKSEVSLNEYLDELKSQPVLTNPALVDSIRDTSPTQHLQNVSATFMTSYKRLEVGQSARLPDSDDLSARLFHLTAHFAPAPISRELLLRALKINNDDSKDKRKLADAINRLCELGLVQIAEEGRVMVHRLLREFAYHHPANGQDVSESAEDVASVMAEYAEEVNESGLPKLGIDLEHLRYIADESEKRGSDEAGGLNNELGYYLKNIIADYSGAKEYYERALRISEAILGNEHPNVAVCVNNIGMVLQDLGDLQGAKEYLERALRIDEKVFGSEHPNVATDVNNIGLVLKALGDLQGAKEYLERALRIGETTFGKEHPEVARVVNNIAGVFYAMGDLQGAKKYLERALRIDETTFGKEHPEVARVVNNIGMVLQALGDLQGAKEHYERALGIFEKFLGSDHPNTQKVRGNLQNLLNEMGSKKM